MKTRNYLILVLLSLLLICCSRQKEIEINQVKSPVVKVISGNKIELKNGLKVEMLGLKPSENSKKYIEEHIKGKTVTLRCDSKQKRKTLKSYKTTVRAYVKVQGESGSLNGKLLSLRLADFNQNILKDSLDSYKRIVQTRLRPTLTDSELLTYMKPATFMIYVREGESEACGTGFFIDQFGLALTNNHVFNYGTDEAVIYFFGKDGCLDKSNYRKINRILLSYKGDDDNAKIDFTVFQIQLDNAEKVSFLPLIDRHINDGERIAKIGCPAGTVCNFQTGNLSNYNEGYFTHSIASNQGDSGGPIVNFRGEAVGINQSIEFNESLSRMTGSVQKAEGIAYAVDALLIREILDSKGIAYGQ